LTNQLIFQSEKLKKKLENSQDNIHTSIPRKYKSMIGNFYEEQNFDTTLAVLFCDLITMYSPNSTWIVTSCLDMFDVSSESRQACWAVLLQHGGW